MATIHYGEDREESGAGAHALRRLVLAVLAVALAAMAAAGGLLGLGDLSRLDPAWLFEWRIGLLFVAGIATIVVLQAFFAQYFDVKLRKTSLLEQLRRDQAEDIAVLEAMSLKTSQGEGRSRTSQTSSDS